MSESMLERVARAIFDKWREREHAEITWEDALAGHAAGCSEYPHMHRTVELAREEARAAIEAMRPITPDDEIWPTLDKARHDDTLSTSGMWAESIDAALEGK